MKNLDYFIDCRHLVLYDLCRTYAEAWNLLSIKEISYSFTEHIEFNFPGFLFRASGRNEVIKVHNHLFKTLKPDWFAKNEYKEIPFFRTHEAFPFFLPVNGNQTYPFVQLNVYSSMDDLRVYYFYLEVCGECEEILAIKSCCTEYKIDGDSIRDYVLN